MACWECGCDSEGEAVFGAAAGSGTMCEGMVFLKPLFVCDGKQCVYPTATAAALKRYMNRGHGGRRQRQRSRRLTKRLTAALCVEREKQHVIT